MKSDKILADTSLVGIEPSLLATVIAAVPILTDVIRVEAAIPVGVGQFNPGDLD